MGAAFINLDSLRAERAAPGEISSRTRTRFAAAVGHARSASPLYRELYAGVPEGTVQPELLPPTDKSILMARYDEWVTDPRVRLADVQDFASDPGRIGAPYLDQYTVGRSSGSSGELCFVLKDRVEVTVQGALRLRAMRRWLPASDLVRLALRRGRTAAVIVTGRHYIGLATIRSGPRRRRAVRVVSAQAPVAEIVRGLNAVRPAILSSYSFVHSILATEREAGRLRISPLLVTNSGDVLDLGERERIERAFGARIGDTYAAAECPFIAHSCEHGWFHLNEDWVLVEPVDGDDRPVLPGEPSTGILVSNLANRVQPTLRYRLDDEILIRPDSCPCGSGLRAMRLIGRRDTDGMRLKGDAGEVELTGSILGVAVGPVGGITAFQLVQTAPDALRLRLRFGRDADPELGWRETERSLMELLANKGLAHVRIERAAEEPQPGPGGKHRKVIPL
jgi:phenylacetate-CoA ligase